jgi:hypothetical protein
MTSPGALFHYTHADDYLGEDVERDYVQRFLPVKLELELVYVQNRSWTYDIWIMLRTAATIARMLAGQRRFHEPPELHQLRQQKHLKTDMDLAELFRVDGQSFGGGRP